jgi:hypothetical protein
MKKIIETIKGLSANKIISNAQKKLDRLIVRRHKEKLQRKKDAKNKV